QRQRSFDGWRASEPFEHHCVAGSGANMVQIKRYETGHGHGWQLNPAVQVRDDCLQPRRALNLLACLQFSATERAEEHRLVEPPETVGCVCDANSHVKDAVVLNTYEVSRLVVHRVLQILATSAEWFARR